MRLFLDCDGVLADFDRGFERHFGVKAVDYRKQHGAKALWEAIRLQQPNFFRNLPLMPDALLLFNRVQHRRPIILTGCPLGGWAEPQKLAWGQEQFKGTPMVTCMSKDKRDFCKPGDVLIDDREQHADLWRRAGGFFLHHTSAVSTLAKLEAMSLI
jgi:hypothetical protein